MVVSRTNASKTVHARPIFSAPESADSHQFFAALWCEACELTAYTRRFTSTNVTCLVPSFLSLLRPQEQRPYSTPCPNYCPLGPCGMYVAESASLLQVPPSIRSGLHHSPPA